MDLSGPVPGVTVPAEDCLAECRLGREVQGTGGATRGRARHDPAGKGGWWHLGCYKLLAQQEVALGVTALEERWGELQTPSALVSRPHSTWRGPPHPTAPQPSWASYVRT